MQLIQMASGLDNQPHLSRSNVKRRRSLSPDALNSRRKTTKKSISDYKQPCPLLQLLSQYGILECVASHLFPVDLYTLASTSKAIYRSIFLRKESHLNLLKKMSCDGSGIRIRASKHRKSKYFTEYGCIERAICGAWDTKQRVETRSCENCGCTTCDECRIHCVYQSIRQPADEPDELDNFSGFVLLDEVEMGILSPAHLSSQPETHTWKEPYHDQGYLDMPLESTTPASVESIDELLSVDLGRYSLGMGDSSDAGRPSPVIRALWAACEQRKRNYCPSCCPKTGGKCCSCTLRKRFLDRWICIKCYLTEDTRSQDHGRKDQCQCGKLPQQNFRTLCSWCTGEVDVQQGHLPPQH